MITLAVLYNLTVVVGRAVFWELDNMFPSGWMVLMMVMAMVVMMVMAKVVVVVVTVVEMVVVMVVRMVMIVMITSYWLVAEPWSGSSKPDAQWMDG